MSACPTCSIGSHHRVFHGSTPCGQEMVRGMSQRMLKDRVCSVECEDQ